MKNSLSKILTLLFGTAAIATVSVAQTQALNGMSARIGVFAPSASFARDVEGGRWFYFGLDYRIPHYTFGENAHPYISADVYSKGSFTSVPLLLNVKQKSGNFTYGVGAGAAFTRGLETSGASYTETSFGYSFVLAYDLTKGFQPIFLEGKFHGNSRTDLNGYSLAIGTRF